MNGAIRVRSSSCPCTFSGDHQRFSATLLCQLKVPQLGEARYLSPAVMHWYSTYIEVWSCAELVCFHLWRYAWLFCRFFRQINRTNGVFEQRRPAIKPFKWAVPQDLDGCPVHLVTVDEPQVVDAIMVTAEHLNSDISTLT